MTEERWRPTTCDDDSTRPLLLTLTLCFASMVPLPAQSQSLRERARTRDVETIALPAYPAATLETLATSANAIVLGEVQSGRPVLSADETRLYTDYRVVVQRVVTAPSARKLAIGETINVRRTGGVMAVEEGFKIISQEAGFPPFGIGERYLWLLTFDPSENLYRIAYGPQGVFRIADGLARQVSGTFQGSSVPRPVAVEPLIDEVLRILKSRR